MKRIFVVFGGVVALWALLYWWAQLVEQPSTPQGLPGFLAIDRPLIMAHRGSRYLTAENTIEGHTQAFRLGADVLEMDVRTTKDNRVVVHHDVSTVRTTGVDAIVHELTLEEIKQLDAGYSYTHDQGKTHPFRGKGIKVPTLEEFLAAFPTAKINIEIKRNNVSETQTLMALLAAQKDPTLRERIVFTSRWCDPLNYIRSKNEGWATAACEAEIPVFLLLCFLRLGPALSHLHSIVPLPFVPRAHVLQIPTVSGVATLLSKTIIDAIHSFGIKVHYWVMNDKDGIRNAIELGADGVITDRFDLGIEVLADLGIGQRIPAEALANNPMILVPEHTPEEVHTCITATCKLFAVIDPALFFATVGLVLLMILVWLSYFIVPSSTSRTKHQANAANTTNNSKKKTH